MLSLVRLGFQADPDPSPEVPGRGHIQPNPDRVGPPFPSSPRGQGSAQRGWSWSQPRWILTFLEWLYRSFKIGNHWPKTPEVLESGLGGESLWRLGRVTGLCGPRSHHPHDGRRWHWSHRALRRIRGGAGDALGTEPDPRDARNECWGGELSGEEGGQWAGGARRGVTGRDGGVCQGALRPWTAMIPPPLEPSC